jgi:hypothetical protein
MPSCGSAALGDVSHMRREEGTELVRLSKRE